jgi:uncharacterized protein (DUF1015 family)
MKIHPFPAIYPNAELIASPDSFFGSVREDYSEFYQSGFFHESADTAFYILEIRTGTKVHTGLIACLDIEDYTKGRIVRHEQTIASSEQAMLKLLLQRGAMVKPVLLCHPPVKEISKELQKQKKKQKLFLRFTLVSGPQQYSLYKVPAKESEELVKLFKAQVPKFYIADGHHRCSTAEKLLKLQGDKKGKDYSMIMCALFSFDQLDILDYNRVVELPYTMKATRLIAELSRCCDIEPIDGPAKPTKKHELTMCLEEDWYVLRWKPELIKKYKKMPAILDAHLLDKEILEPIFGISDLRSDTRVGYISGDHGPERVADKARALGHYVGFCIYPVQFDELVRVSDSHGELPPKSTWFEPRMINGLIVKSY